MGCQLLPSSFFFLNLGLRDVSCSPLLIVHWPGGLNSLFFMCEKELITFLPTIKGKDVFLKKLSEKGEWSHVQVFTDFVLGMC